MTYFLRVGCTGIPAALFLGCLGFMFAHLNGLHLNDGSLVRGLDFIPGQHWQLSIVMAAAGLGLMALYELCVECLQPPVKKKRYKTQNVDTESMLMELLDQADAAEQVRKSSIGFQR